MKKIKFILAFHNHQPVGNFGFVLEEAFIKAYQPFLDVIEKFPRIKMTLHYTGILWEWFRDKHPDFIERLRALHQSGQLELMGGGFFEPVLPSIPPADRQGQLELTNRFLAENFNCQPRGIWLAERVWEPGLPKTISEAGLEYVVVDDSHFKAVGLSERDLLGMFITEEEGFPLNVFPISEKLRYLIPFQQPEKTREYLQELAGEDESTLIVIADDGEKLGNWPGTHQWVYHEKWLERFFTMLSENTDLIETTTFSEYLSDYPPRGRVYLPTASYTEMMEWALPTKTLLKLEQFKDELKAGGLWQCYQSLVGAGFWRNFLVKYPESNDLHKKMYYLSGRIHNSKALSRAEREAALRELWQAQCNCPYWHGAFGGLYLKHLRYATYRHLIEAELKLDSAEQPGKEWCLSTELDINQDGHNEVLLRNARQNLYLAPALGGMLYEWDIKAKRLNILNTLTRREEAYHRKLRELNQDAQRDQEVASIHDLVKVKEDGLENKLFYDWYRRASLLDHFLGWGSDFSSFQKCRHNEEGDFVNQPYTFSLEKDPGGIRLIMTRRGSVWRSGKKYPVEVKKTIVWNQSEAFSIIYRITNLSGEKLELWWGPEMNFSFIGASEAEEFVRVGCDKVSFNRTREFLNTREFHIEDIRENWQLDFQLDSEAALWVFPIETVSNSEAGLEKVYQSTVVFPSFKMSLAREESWDLNIGVKLSTG